MRSFQIGDLVRRINSNYLGIRIGMEGRVLHIRPSQAPCPYPYPYPYPYPEPELRISGHENIWLAGRNFINLSAVVNEIIIDPQPASPPTIYKVGQEVRVIEASARAGQEWINTNQIIHHIDFDSEGRVRYFLGIGIYYVYNEDIRPVIKDIVVPKRFRTFRELVKSQDTLKRCNDAA